MLKLPDVIQIGPFPVPTFPVALLAGFYAWHALSERSAGRCGLEKGWVGDLLYRLFIGALVGAKLFEVIRSPASFVASPRLLVSVPVGPLAVLGALLGAAAWMALAVNGRWRQLPRVADAVAAPLAVGLTIVASGSGDERSLPLAIGFLLVAGALMFLQRQGAFNGHTALAAVVLGSVVVVASDFFRPASALAGGLNPVQLVSAAIGGATYALALRLERALVKKEHGG